MLDKHIGDRICVFGILLCDDSQVVDGISIGSLESFKGKAIVLGDLLSRYARHDAGPVEAEQSRKEK